MVKLFFYIAMVFIATNSRNVLADFEIAKTNENIPKKALIIKEKVSVFRDDKSNDSIDTAKFMSFFFLMKPERGNRVPISKSFYKKEPDGWLEKDSFIEWNTVQLIDFDNSIQNREPLNIYETLECSVSSNNNDKCQILGNEVRNFNKNTNKKQYKLFAPVFQKEKVNNSFYYHAGFASIYEKQGVTFRTPSSLGYDLILVVDSTYSMRNYFKPTVAALKNLVHYIQKTAQNIPLNIGLLLFRDRDGRKQNCSVDYIYRWEQELTNDINKVINALENVKASTCSDIDDPEAVFDALNRAIVDTPWNPNHFNSILLIGDAPPHTVDLNRNPMQFSVKLLHDLASKDERKIRFLTIKINNKDIQEFQELALSNHPEYKGRFSVINRDEVEFKNYVEKILFKEWDILLSSKKQLSAIAPYYQNTETYNDDFPVIKTQLKRADGFVKGWISQKHKEQQVIKEYILMRDGQLEMLIATLELIKASFYDGRKQGGETIISTLRQSLVSQLNLKEEEVFSFGQSLSDIFNTVNILPFKSQLLSITREDLLRFKPIDYENFLRDLIEKILLLREFKQSPKVHFSKIGEDKYYYVPHSLFP